MNAVQGARESGAANVIVANPVADKQKWALDFGATESFDSIASAMGRIQELTNGQGADVAILSAGIVDNALIGEGLEAIRKAGTLVVRGRACRRLPARRAAQPAAPLGAAGGDHA